MDPFELLDVPARFDLDQQALHRQFLQKVAATHPDRFQDPVQQADAAEQAAAINMAYRALSDPESRARALVRRWQPSDDVQDPEDQALPPDLLMTMMEIRERLEQALEDDDQRVVDEIAHWASQERTSALQQIGEWLGQASTASNEDREALLIQVRMSLHAIRYYQRTLEQIP